MTTTFELYDGSITLDLLGSSDYSLTGVSFGGTDERQETFAGTELRRIKFLPHRIEATLNILGSSTASLQQSIRNLTEFLRKAEGRQVLDQGTKTVLKYQLGDTDADDISQRVLSGSLIMPDTIIDQVIVDQNIAVNARLSLLLEPLGRLPDVSFGATVLENEVDGDDRNYIDLDGTWSGYMEFDGASGDVTVGDTSDIQDIWGGGGTVEFWVYPRSDGEDDQGRLLSKRAPGWAVYFDAETNGFIKLNFYKDFSDNDGWWRGDTSNIPINEWSHIAIVYDDVDDTEDPVFYLNGVSFGIFQVAAPLTNSDSDVGQDLVIGQQFDGIRSFDGFIDDLRLWDDERSEAEILANFEGELNGDEANLVAYYRFSELTGTRARDATATPANGVVTSAANWAIGERKRGTSGGRLELKIQDTNNGGGNAWSGDKKMWIAKRSGERRTDTLQLDGPDSVTDSYSVHGFLTVSGGVTGGPTTNAGGGTSAYRRYTSTSGSGKTIESGSNQRTAATYAHNIASGNVPSGRFRILARWGVDDDGNGIYANPKLGVNAVYGGTTIIDINDTSKHVDLPTADESWHWVDMGEIILPGIGIPGGSTATPSLDLDLYWLLFPNGGTWGGLVYNEVSLDYVFLLPVDEGVVIVDSVGTDDRVLISNKEDVPGVWLLNTSDVVQSVATFNGGPFNLGPEITRIIVIRDDVGDPTTTQFTLTPVYTPLVQGI